jgi:hypothetical protein
MEDNNGIEYIKCPETPSSVLGKMYYQRITRVGDRVDLGPAQSLTIDGMVPTGKTVYEEQLNR